MNDVIEAYNAKEKKQIELSYLQASQTANFIGMILNGKNIPPIDELYPNMYQEQSSNEDITDVEFKKMMFLKDQMISYAQDYNNFRRKQEAMNL